MKEISSNVFSYTDGVFATEASTCGFDLGKEFVMRSARTGAAVKFVRKRIKRDQDGDIIFAEYESCYLPSLPREARAVIFND